MRFFKMLLLGCIVATALCGHAQDRSGFDVEKATRAYLDRMTPAEKARSNAYFEGNEWLQLWSFLFEAGIAILLLETRLSARMRDQAQRLSRFKPVQSLLYGMQFILLMTLLAFPLDAYADFFREHQYGMSNQHFGGWMHDHLIELLVNLVVGSLLLMALFGVVRRLRNTWHVWGAVVSVTFMIIFVTLGPVYIAPLLNKYTLLSDPKVVDPILHLARANGIQSDKVYEMDASKQTKRVSANVSGFLGTTRITLNDNLINRCTLPEVEAVMAHEMGHYVLNHAFKIILFFSILFVVGFVWLRFACLGLLRRFGARWRIAGIDDLAVTPLAILAFSAYLFILTPLTNTFIRSIEMEADMFGLNAARQPDGFAEAALKLGEYRKMEPGPVEEWIFFDHPSGATRIRTAMRWKADNLPSP